MTAAKEYAQKIRMKGVWDEQIHAMDYLIYAALQSAQDTKARSVLDELRSIQAVNLESPKVAYPVAAIPARYALERRRWTEAAQLTAPDWLKLDRFPWAEAMVCFARGVGAARSGQPAAAQAELENIRAIHGSLVEKKLQDWALPTDILMQELAAWTAVAEGKHTEAVRLMTGAADLEDSTEKLPLTPGPIIPAREQLGDLLLEAKDPSAALREYETSLRSSPNRFNGLYGAGKAARAAGDTDKARAYFAKLVEVCSHAKGDRPELAEARTFLNAK
jgi:tetratricopeptide (TPR) repeat protein